MAALLLVPPLAAQESDPPPAAAPEAPPPANPFADPGLPARLIEQSERHYFRREYVEAMQALEAAVQFAPEEARRALEAGLSLQASGDAAGALLAFQDAVRRFPAFVTIFTGLGFVRNETGDFYSALRDFGVAIDLFPHAYLAYAGRAESKLGLDDYAGAIEDLSVQIRAGEKAGLERVLLKRGQARLALGEIPAAGEDFAAALQLEPKLTPAWLLNSYTLKYSGRFDEALASLDQAISLAPEFAQAYSARSWTHQELGRPEAAVADADRAIELQPDIPDFVLNRAMLHDLLDHPDAARSDYARAIALAEDKANNVVWFYASFHLDLLSRRLEGKPLDAYLGDLLTWPDCWQKRLGLFLAGKITPESLLKDATQASRLPERNNQECEARYFIGMLALLGGDRAAAREALESCIATNDLQTVEFAMAKAQLRRLTAADSPATAAQ